MLDVERRILSVSGEPLALGPRVVATLAALVERAGDVVTKDEILDGVWADEDVGESNVAQSVYTLRKVLRDHGVGDAIVTVPRRGYRFAAEVERLAELPSPRLPIRFEARVASGYRRLVLAAAASVALIALAGVEWARALPHGAQLSAHGAEAYRLGRYYWNLRTSSGLAKSVRLFTDVVASDPRSPLGYAALADADMTIADYERSHVKTPVYYARARTEIRTALALDPGSAAAHASLAMLHYAADHDAAAADAEFHRAIELDPNYALAHHWLGTTLLERGRLADGSRELRIAEALEPVAAATAGWLAEASYYDHRYADAIRYARRALDLDPRRHGALSRLGLAYEMSGDLPHAIRIFEKLRRAAPSDENAHALLAEAYARAGRRDEARAALRVATRLHPKDDDTAFAMLALGERGRGLAILSATRMSGELQDPRIEPFRAALRAAAVRGKPTD